MAAPGIRGVVAPLAGLSADSPAGTQVGDLVVLFTWEVAGAGVPTHTLQSGFTQILSQAHDDGSTDGRLSIAYKVATSAGTNTYQPYTSSDGTNTWTSILVLNSGEYDAAGIKSASTNNTTNAVPDPPSVGSLDSAADYLMVAGATWHFSSTGTLNPTAPTNYTLQTHVSGGALGDVAVSTRAMEPVGAASEDPAAYNDNLGPNGTTAFTVAFPEASAGTTITLGSIARTRAMGAISLAAQFTVALSAIVRTRAMGAISLGSVTTVALGSIVRTRAMGAVTLDDGTTPPVGDGPEQMSYGTAYSGVQMFERKVIE